MASLKDILTTLRNVADDLTTLDVVTLTGTVKIAQQQTGKIDLKALYQELSGAASSATSDIEVVAFTHIDFDTDTVNFVKTGAGEGDRALLEAHQAMVKTSQDTRASVIKMVKDVIGI